MAKITVYFCEPKKTEVEVPDRLAERLKTFLGRWENDPEYRISAHAMQEIAKFERVVQSLNIKGMHLRFLP